MFTIRPKLGLLVQSSGQVNKRTDAKLIVHDNVIEHAHDACNARPDAYVPFPYCLGQVKRPVRQVDFVKVFFPNCI